MSHAVRSTPSRCMLESFEPHETTSSAGVFLGVAVLRLRPFSLMFRQTRRQPPAEWVPYFYPGTFLEALVDVLPNQTQGKSQEADSLYVRAINVFEKTIGVDHPVLAETLHNRAMSLNTQVRERGRKERCVEPNDLREFRLQSFRTCRHCADAKSLERAAAKTQLVS